MALDSRLPPLTLERILSCTTAVKLPWPLAMSTMSVERTCSMTIESEPTEGIETSLKSSLSVFDDESKEKDLQTNEKVESEVEEETEMFVSTLRKAKPYSFKRTLNCWKNFDRRNVKLKDNRKLKHNVTQTYFRGLKDTIKHLETVSNYDFSSKFIGVACKTKADKRAWQAFMQGVRPYVAEVYQHFCSMLHYNHANVSFCQKERMKSLEVPSTLRAYLHYSAFVFFDLNSKRLEEKFNVAYNGYEPVEEVWLAVKSYYVFVMLIEEVCLSEAELLQTIQEEGLSESFSDAFRFYKALDC